MYLFQPLSIVADLMKEEDVVRVVDETIKQYGKLDILVRLKKFVCFRLHVIS